MAEKIISPGVFTDEIDQSFLPAAIGEIGAVVIGPTVKGPALVPTVVDSFSEYEQLFGTSFKSGSQYYQYLTSHAAESYLKHGSKLTVVRILAGDFNEATASIGNSATSTSGIGSASLQVRSGSFGGEQVSFGDGSTTYEFVFVSGSSQADVCDTYSQGPLEFFVHSGSSNANTATNLTNIINVSASAAGVSASRENPIDKTEANWVSIYSGSNFIVASSSNDVGYNSLYWGTSASFSGSVTSTTTGNSFKLHTIADGAVMNNIAQDSDKLAGSNNTLLSGSSSNLRWEVSNVNDNKGTFTLVLRSGKDTIKRKQILETWTNVSLDPNSNNYIAKRMGDSKMNFAKDTDGIGYLQPSGSYLNKSKYAWVEVLDVTPDYLDENGAVRIAAQSNSLPDIGSGSNQGAFGGGSNGWAGFDGMGNSDDDASNSEANYNFYDKIDSESQGYSPNDSGNSGRGYDSYIDALTLLNNADEYDFNLLLMPGITQDNHGAVVNKAIDVCEDRGDCFVIADPTQYGKAITDATGEANDYDSNYAAMYYPWIQVPDVRTGQNRWVPPSTVMGGIYAFNDKVAQPWFAPAGLNRGGIENAIQAERKLTHGNRDTLYDANVNPIATFPGQGVTIWGQKTLQKKASALDRINVRRLLIKVKKFIAASSRFLVFEQNNSATRKRFLSIANPFLEQVQSNSGLNAFKVVMDETNNTPDTIDRNIMYGQLFLQPTRTAEFIVLDFTIQPTGASFPE